MMLAAFDHMDRVDLDIAEMFNRRPRRLRSGAEGSTLIKPLRPQPKVPRLGFRNWDRRSMKHEARNTEPATRSRHRCVMSASGNILARCE